MIMFCLLNRFGCASIRHFHPTLSKANIRSLSLSLRSKRVKLADPSLHKPVYFFNYIRLCSVFLSSRIFVPVGSAILGPCASLILKNWDLITPLVISNAIHLVFVTIAAKFLNNVVGIVFVNKEGDINEVIFSSIDKWGRRTDRKHNLDEIFIVSDNSMITMAGFFVVAAPNSNIRYKVNFKNGKVYDFAACKIVFDDFEFLPKSNN